MPKGELVSVIQVVNDKKGTECLKALKKAIKWKYCIHTRCRNKDRRKVCELRGTKYIRNTQNDVPIEFADRYFVYVYERVRGAV